MTHICMRVRYTQGTYAASSPGQTLRATAVMSAKAAALALAAKIYPQATAVQAERLQTAPVGEAETWRCHIQFTRKV